MKTAGTLTILVMALGFVAGLVQPCSAEPLDTAFTYQGHLYDSNDPANGLYDFKFRLYDGNDPCDANQIGSDVNKPDIDVVDGYFAVQIDFGSDAFDGSAVWLRTAVRAGALDDPNLYTSLSPTQPVTAVPYTLQTRGFFVDSLGNVGVGTTTPKSKLDVAGGIAIGETTQMGKPHSRIPKNNVTTTVDSNSVGTHSSLTIAPDGLPVISYYNSSDGDLYVAKCSTGDCNAPSDRPNKITSVDNIGLTGKGTSITIAPSGACDDGGPYPVISYIDSSNKVKLAVCCSHNCSSGTKINTVDNSGTATGGTSITIAPSGNPIVAFVSTAAGGSLVVGACGTKDCSSGNTLIDIDTSGNILGSPSLAIGPDRLPGISYYDAINGSLLFVKCATPDCNSIFNVKTVIDDVDDVGEHSSLTIGEDGFPLIAYRDSTNGDLKVAKCTSQDCNSAPVFITRVDTTGDVGEYPAVSIAGDGFPVIAYRDVSNNNIKFVKCGTPDCNSDNTPVTVDSNGIVGEFASLAIGADGSPVMSYHSAANGGSDGDLVVLTCANPFCIPFWTRR